MVSCKSSKRKSAPSLTDRCFLRNLLELQGFVIPTAWEPELEVMAHSLGSPVQDMATIRERFQAVLAAIAPLQREKRST